MVNINIFIYTWSFFIGDRKKKSQVRKQIFLKRFIMGNIYIFPHSELTRNALHIFQRYHTGYFMADAM